MSLIVFEGFGGTPQWPTSLEGNSRTIFQIRTYFVSVLFESHLGVPDIPQIESKTPEMKELGADKNSLKI